ncbi:MAG: hypothetical protein IKN60_01990 [Bacteroidales bacterium]|nr:hypothetical protein [Bacteroidales bacterium]
MPERNYKSNPIASYSDISGISLHYSFIDNQHYLDASVFNHCEGEVLALFNQVVSQLHGKCTLVVEPVEPGSLLSILRGIGKGVILPLSIGLLTSLIYSKLDKKPERIVKEVIEEILSDQTLLQSLEEREDLKQEIELLKRKKDSIATSFDENIIVKRRSNYFQSLYSDPRVSSVEIGAINDTRLPIKTRTILRTEFPDYILNSDELDPAIEEEAEIDIISPVLRRGVKTRWTGIYDGAIIQFTIKSNEFKTRVQLGEVSFKNGSRIICDLVKARKLDQNGNVVIKSYTVDTVYSVVQNDLVIETTEGKVKRVRKKEKEQDQSLFDDI